jgi:hypothetical protein
LTSKLIRVRCGFVEVGHELGLKLVLKSSYECNGVRKTHPALVESKSMPKIANGIVRCHERKIVGKHPNARDRVEYTDELNLDVDRKGTLELPTEVQSFAVLANIEPVGRVYRLFVSMWEKSNLNNDCQQRDPQVEML